MTNNSKPLIFILLSFIFVLAISFLGNTVHVFGLQFKNINIISDLFPGITRDSVVSDEPVNEKAISKSDVEDFKVSDAIVGYEEAGPLQKFVVALHELKSGKRKKVRIGYMGDSMIEGDLITQDLRKYLQIYFGGSGVGFVPITSVVAGFRQSIVHSFSDDWTDQNFLNTSRSGAPLFFSGHVFRPSAHSVVRYETPGSNQHSLFDECYLIYGTHDSLSHFVIDDSVLSYTSSMVINKQLVAAKKKVLHGSFSGSDNQLYGFSFESHEGVFVDNLAFRGISGIELQKITGAMMGAAAKAHPYDLIILQYGPNLLFKPELTDFRWYEKPLKSVISMIQSYYPEASILIIGSADKSCRYEGEYETQKGVEPLINIQNRVAYEAKVNFWNLFNAMGGRNSMKRWVKMQPPLANLDYTHLTHKGAQVVAKSLFDQIMQVYDPEAASRSQIQPFFRYVSASRTL